MNKFTSFILGIFAVGLLGLIIKPVYDDFNNATTGVIQNTTGVTTFEIAWFSVLPFLIPLIVIAFLVFKYIRRDD